LRIAGAGFDAAEYPVMLVPAGVQLSSTSTTTGFVQAPIVLTTLAPPKEVDATLFIASPTGSSGTLPTLRAGADLLQVGVTSSHPRVAAPSASMVTFAPGGKNGVAFNAVPGEPGTTIFSLNPPVNFHAGGSY